MSIDYTPLVDALFETSDSECLFKDIIDSLENESPWPKRLYESGEATKIMGHTAVNALGKVLHSIEEEEEARKSRRTLVFQPPSHTTKVEPHGSESLASAGIKRYNLRSTSQILKDVKRPEGSESPYEGPTKGKGKDVRVEGSKSPSNADKKGKIVLGLNACGYGKRETNESEDVYDGEALWSRTPLSPIKHSEQRRGRVGPRKVIDAEEWDPDYLRFLTEYVPLFRDNYL